MQNSNELPQRPRRNIRWVGALRPLCEHHYRKIEEGEPPEAAPRRCIKCGRLEVNL